MRRSRPLDLKPLSAVQEGVRQVKEHVAMDGTSAEPPERRSRTHMAVSPPGMPCRLSHLSKPSRNWHLAKREPSGSPPASVPTQWIVAWAFNGVPISRAKAKTPRLSGNPSTMRNPSTERPLRYGGSSGVGAQMSKKTMSVHCPVCNVSSPRDLSELARPSGQSCLICGALLSDYAWGELATALLAGTTTLGPFPHRC